MNQARSGRYYDPDDFAAKRPIPWMAILGAVVLAWILCGAAFFYGDSRGFIRGKAWTAAQPKHGTPQPVLGLRQWQCTSQERAEYMNVCIGRFREQMKVR
jgi:hypothetical protein